MKKLLTLTLSLLMAFSMCLTVSAEEGNYAEDTVAVFLKRHAEDTNAGPYDEIEYTSLQEAINAAKDGVTTTVELVKDTTESVIIPKGKSIILFFNGKTLTAEDNKDAIFVESGAYIYLKGMGGKIIATTSGYATVFNNGGADLAEGLQCVRNDSSKWYIVVNHGTMRIVEGVKIESTNASDTSSAVENGYADYNSGNARSGYVEGVNEANPTLTISEFDVEVSTYGCNAVKNDDGGILTINDGNFKTINKDNGAVVQNWNVATINGGTFTAQNSLSVVSNGAYDTGEVNKGQLTINGGTFVQDGSYADGVVFAYGQGASTPEYGTTKVYGGTFTGNLANTISYKLEILGGAFSNDVSEYLAKDYNVVKLGGVYNVVSKDTKVDVKENTAAVSDEARSAINTAAKNGKVTDDKGEPVTVDSSTEIELSSVSKTLSSDETKKVESVKESVIKELKVDTAKEELKYIPLDITLTAINKVDGQTVNTTISELGEKIAVTLYLKDETANALKNKSFKIIRIHNGDAETLPDEDVSLNTDDGILTFKTDKFSTYVIAHSSPISTSNSVSTATKTYDAKDKNQDGVVSCEEEMNSANWIWSEIKQACVYNVSNTSVR